MIGSRLGAYEILAELGSGGMGKVYRAEVARAVAGLEEGRVVALKVIHTHLLETEGFFKRFLREAQIGRQVEHENVVRTHDCDALLVDGEQQHFLVMEYVEGQTLRDLLKELERVPEELCRHIGHQVALGLAAIHEAGVVHRDVKPENVLITEDHVVKVMDLGVARLQDEAMRLSQAGAFVGSLEYAAPEQFSTVDGDPDGRADLHALGVLLYELSTGRHPYRDEDASRVLRNILDVTPRKAGEVNPQLSPFFEEVVHTLIAKDREQRFPSASILARVLADGEKSDWWKARARALRIETKRPLRRIRIPRETALYGREEDLGKMRALYEKVGNGDGQVLLIEGEAGIGKTRLVDEFVARLREEGEDLNFLFGPYPPGGAATAAGAFSTAYRQHFEEQGLEETLAGYLQATPILVPAFAALLRGESVPTGAEPLTKESLQTVFVHATRALADERPTIVLIDDLHFAPEEGRALFASLAHAVAGHRILLIGTTRRGLPETWISHVTRLDHATQRLLQRLGPKHLARLLEDAFRSKHLAEELSHRIAMKSDGNPFFAFEIIRGLREGQFIAQRSDGAWVTTRVIEDIQVPSTVTDLVRARLAGIDDDEKNLLDVASCCGFEFDPLLVADVLGQAQIPAMQRLARIEQRHHLVRSAGRHFVFDHHQVQEALYEGLPQLLREPYHAAIADARVARDASAGGDPGRLDGGLCVAVCEHYLKGAQGTKALPYLEPALEHLRQGYLNDQVVALADSALDVDGLLEGRDRVGVLLRKEKQLHLLGRRDEQRAVLEEARAVAEALDDNGREHEHEREALLGAIERARSQLSSAQGDYTAACEGWGRSVERYVVLGDRENEALARVSRGLALMRLGRLQEAREALEGGRAFAREIGSRKTEGGATRLLGDLAKDTGRFEEALACQLEAQAIAEELKDPAFDANCAGSLGNLYQVMGRQDEARERYGRWRALARSMGDRQGEAAATGNLGIVDLQEGRLQEARESFEQHRALACDIGDRQGELNATANLALVCDALGQYGASRAWNEKALAVARRIGSRDAEKHITGNLGGVLAILGRWSEARDHLERSLVLAHQLQDPRAQGHALDGLAQVAEARGEADAAVRLAEEALALFREQKNVSRAASVLVGLARLHADAGDVPRAVGDLTEALRLATEAESTESIVRARIQWALLPDGDVEAAVVALAEHEDRLEAATRMECRFRLWQATGGEEHLAEAGRLLDHLVEHAPEDCRESMLEDVPLYRDIGKARASDGPERAEGG